jgi:hypothetical protein
MAGMSGRALSFGVVAEGYERFRPGYPVELAPFLDSDEVPSPDGTPPGHDMQWPGTELRRSEWFADVQQSVIERRLTMSARDYIGHLSTISAYLELPASAQEQVYSRIMQVLPETIEIAADITVHLARRRCQQ